MGLITFWTDKSSVMTNDDTGIRRIDEVLDFLYDIFLDVCMIGPAVGAAYPSV